MEGFLRRAYTALTDDNTDLSNFNVHMVIGNEAADLDSVISSVVMGYMLHCRKNSDPNTITIPVLVCPREDLPLRTEVTHWLRKHTIAPDWLVHREDVTRWWTRVKGERFRSFSVTLVDHNMPIGDMEFVTQYIVRILDHHVLMPEMEETIQLVADAGELFWEMVGSCCTLVAQRYFEGVCGEFEMTPEEKLLVLALLYGVILLDTLCLSPQHERFRPLDIEMLARIEAEMELTEASREHVYHELEGAKFDVTGLTNLDLLRRDVKFIRPHLAICSICGIDYTKFIHLPHIVNDIVNYCKSEAVGITVILTLGKGAPSDAELRRGIIVSRTSDHDCPTTLDLIDYLRSDPNLALESYPAPNQRLVVFGQNNAKLSRKYIMPSIAKFLKGMREVNQPGITSTPLNSPQVTSDAENLPEASNRDLPSFNNLATVQKVQAKRNNLSSEKEPTSPDPEASRDSSGARSPYAIFTPENSALVTPEEDNRRVHHLPSLNNRATVDLVAEKRRRGWRQSGDADMEDLREYDDDSDRGDGAEEEKRKEEEDHEEEDEEGAVGDEGRGVNIQMCSGSKEAFTPVNSLTRDGFLARLMHKGQDTGRTAGFDASQLSEEDAKRIAGNVVLSALKGGVRRTVRSALENDVHMSESQNTEDPKRDSLKMRFSE